MDPRARGVPGGDDLVERIEAAAVDVPGLGADDRRALPARRARRAAPRRPCGPLRRPRRGPARRCRSRGSARARSMVTWRSSLTSSRTRGAPCRPPTSASHPAPASTALRAAARHVTCACWQPVVRPNARPPGAPAGRSATPRPPPRPPRGGRHRVAAGVLVPARRPRRRRRSPPAARPRSRSRSSAATGCARCPASRRRRARRAPGGGRSARPERHREPRAQGVDVEHVGPDAAVGERLEEVGRVAGGGGQQVAGVHLSRLSLPFGGQIAESRSAFGNLIRPPRTASKETDPAMEPASLPVTKGRGSIEDPEVLENVPGHVIPILEREFDDFDTESAKYLRGETPETEFIGFRLKQGVYGQRQPDVQMVRVKLPMGGITPEQLEAFADGIERYAPLNKGHITTRQNIQIHHIPLDDAAKFIRELSDAGLSSREGCGNTVRNVTGDPWAGVAPDELFDLTPYAGAYVRYFVRHPTTQLMPRKVKTAFDASPEDRALTGIHDIAFIARERDGAARRRGARRWRHVDHAARRADALRLRRPRRRRVPRGGRGGLPHLRPPGLAARQPRPRAHQGPRRQDRHRRDAQARRRGAPGRLGRRARVRRRRPAPGRRRGRPRARGPELLRLAQRRRQRVRALPRIERHRPAPGGLLGRAGPRPRGDLSPEQLRALADIARRYSGGWVRTTVHQNLLLRWVRDETVYEVWRGAARTGPRRRGGRPGRRRRLCPAPTRASSASPRRWASMPRCASAWTRCRSPIRSRAGCTSR